ncbi:hypothetical protein NQ318_006146 [Aromia moschata]|uniref:Uncharacterized protein n=1 Tax=Aromia moschata TaxID=1265417 RepID=A0AAV8XM21_9CUCU|nr:hypothetical protein NQ318_006146 [Aromia moschata]
MELKERSSKSLLANVLDIDDDFSHSANEDSTRQGPASLSPCVSNHACISADYALAMILKEIRFITDQLRKEDDATT